MRMCAMLNIGISAYLQMKVQMAMLVSSKFQLHISDIKKSYDTFSKIDNVIDLNEFK